MKIVAISDTHGQIFSDRIPKCDILLHCGDISPMREHSIWYQRQWFIDTFIPELQKCPAKNILFIAGNHDFFLYDTFKSDNENWLREQLPSNVQYLRDSGCTINGITFYGTPWVVNLPRWAFSKNENANNYKYITTIDSEIDELRGYFSKIPHNVDYLLSHGPAQKFCDTIMEYNMTEHIGSATLTEVILTKRIKHVLTGHIHSANHEEERMVHDTNMTEFTTFNCVSLLDESYKLGKYNPKVFIENERNS